MEALGIATSVTLAIATHRIEGFRVIDPDRVVYVVVRCPCNAGMFRNLCAILQFDRDERDALRVDFWD